MSAKPLLLAALLLATGCASLKPETARQESQALKTTSPPLTEGEAAGLSLLYFFGETAAAILHW